MQNIHSESQTLQKSLQELLPDSIISIDDADRVAYARDLWPRHHMKIRAGIAAPAPPDIVVWPEDEAALMKLVQFALPRGIPVVPFGAGSGVCGGILPDSRSIVVDMKRMNKMLEVNRDALTCTAQAGMIGQHLEDFLNEKGCTLGHFPSSIYCSTLGGWVAARSAGQCSGRYGKIEDMLLSMRFIDGTGRLWEAEKNGENKEMIPMVVGSEGTYGFVTQAKLRIAPAPSSRRFSSFVFPSTEAGIEAIRRIFQAGLRPAVARLYDPFDTLLARQGGVKGSVTNHEQNSVVEEASKSKGPSTLTQMLVKALHFPLALNRLIDALPERALGGALMVLVWESHPRIANEEFHQAQRISRELEGTDLGEGPARKWFSHRHSVSYRQSPILAAGGFLDTMEVASCWSNFLPMYESVKSALSPYAFVMAHFSHAYPDGASIYFTFAGHGSSEEESLEKYDAAWRKALHAVVASGGTFSHHHGVGRSKTLAMHPEQDVAVHVMSQVKRVFDPAGIMNPGAVLPEDEQKNVGEVRT